MKWLDRYLIKHITWMKPIDNCTLQELFQLQQDVGKAIAKKMEIK